MSPEVTVRRVYDALPPQRETRGTGTAEGPVALLTATRDVDRSNAAVLAEILRRDSR